RLVPKRPDDRAILALAVPALGALAADPLYSLVDTAFVGHLGTAELGALAVGSAAFTASFWIFSFLAYGVTPKVAAAFGRGDAGEAASIGVQAALIAVASGLVVTLLGVLGAGPIVRLLGAEGEVATIAEPYLRIRVLSSTAVLLGQVGHGWLRGAQDTRTPMLIAVAGAVFNIVLDYVFIYIAGWGVSGAAWATVVAQGGAAVAFIWVLRPHTAAVPMRLDLPVARSLLSVGRGLVVRTGALLAAMTLATALAARMGTLALGSWQIAMQLFLFLALVLDSIAIAAQALIGRALGADARGTRALAGRLMWWGSATGVILGAVVLLARQPVATLFSNDPEVVDAAVGLLTWVALVQPLSAVAFTLDGILIGALQTDFLAKAMLLASGVYGAGAAAAYLGGAGTAGLALAATAWLGVRVVTTGLRFRSDAWLTPL
ncbi:MAG TPA: MATE family efflux transporter, partial [Actinomycetota bacterium]|nr:MATE family efflux transporter [Actinomycetota bacterium]